MLKLVIAISAFALIFASPAYAPPVAIAKFYEREDVHSSLGNFKGATESWQGEIILRKQRRIIGASTTTCIRVSSAIRNCTAAYALPEGVLVAQGLVGSLKVYSLTITGGTGAYLGYFGWINIYGVTVEPRTSQLTFHLLRS